MTRVLVTGGTGGLGRELVPRLTAAGHTVRVMSRRAGESNALGDVEWAQADLRTANGLAEAAAGVDTVMHAASAPFKDTRETDVEGTRRLLDASKAAGVSNFYYVSIVGVDRIKYPYYEAKFAAEKAIEEAGAPYTILRATQFHTLLDGMISTLLKRGPFLVVPGALKFQLIETGEVADHIVSTLSKGASGRLPDIGGPQVLEAREIVRAWLSATGKRLIKVPVPAMGWMKGLAAGYNTCPENGIGKITWKEWLAGRYGKPGS